jgi:RNA polymerase sigma-70 factor (ECF subfamily)
MVVQIDRTPPALPQAGRSRNVSPEPDEEDALIARAVAGDATALESLLLKYYDRLLRRVSRDIPQNLPSVLSAEDVLQDTFVEAFRSIRRFTPQGEQRFFSWLGTIAAHRLTDAIKALRRAKRGGGMRPLRPADDSRGIAALLENLKVSERTPSRSVAVREAVSAVRVALSGSKEEYREVLQLRYLEGLPVTATAERMNKTEAAVHKLSGRALERLRQALGRSSKYFSSR